MSFDSGFIAIVGAPNVGKSTLMNRLLGTRLAIVSPRPQTTRNRILGVCHGDGYQMVFMDTPGIHRTRTILHQSMVESALAAFQEVDQILWVIDGSRPDEAPPEAILSHLTQSRGIPRLLAVNKIDRFPRQELLPLIDRYQTYLEFAAVVPISALTGEGVDVLRDELRSGLRPGPAFFPPDMQTDQSESFLIAEMIREQLFRHLKQELPYSCAVTVSGLRERTDREQLDIAARIHVESPSQKKIVVGRGGRIIRTVGQAARLELERFFRIKVFLDLLVRVEKNWSRDPKALQRLGY